MSPTFDPVRRSCRRGLRSRSRVRTARVRTVRCGSRPVCPSLARCRDLSTRRYLTRGSQWTLEYRRAMVHNVHEREIAAGAEAVGKLLDSLSSMNDRLWPHDQWPSMRFDRPLEIGAVGGHGPVRYVVENYVPGRWVEFRFTRPSGFEGHHWFSVSEESENSSVLRHELVMTVKGTAVLTWPLFFRPLHDALIEESLDRAESAVGTPPSVPAKRSLWTRALRSMWSFPTFPRKVHRQR